MIGSDNYKVCTLKDASPNQCWDVETLEASGHVYSYDFSTPKYRLILQGYGTGFESYSQHFFSQYRFTMTPKTRETTTSTNMTTTIDTNTNGGEEDGEENFVRFKERLSKVDIESCEFQSMFPNLKEAIQLVEYLKEEVKDPELRTIWSLLEKLPKNLQDKVDMEEIDFLLTKQRKLRMHNSKSSKKLDRFKVRTLDLGGGVVVKDEGK